ncbi:unnamed protein product [Linum trigynum]|uniref:Uncharacterized protein n=1 Tax=Linum trigynum TaxID=586398 RepID=A0AAV2D096_9ROSI
MLENLLDQEPEFPANRRRRDRCFVAADKIAAAEIAAAEFAAKSSPSRSPSSLQGCRRRDLRLRCFTAAAEISDSAARSPSPRSPPSLQGRRRRLDRRRRRVRYTARRFVCVREKKKGRGKGERKGGERERGGK